MEKNSTALRERLARVPERPGVYIMHDAEGTIIYVGKAQVLRNRLRSYFTGTAPDAKTEKLVETVTRFEYIITSSEIEALVLEAQLIRKHKPHFNIYLKDDKKFPFVQVSLGEDFPRVLVTRDLVADGSRYFGPYPDAKALRRTTRYIEWIFPLRTCSLKIEDGKKARPRPCMNYQMGKCPAPCAGLISREDYGEIVKQTVRFLQGRDSEVVESLKEEMQRLSDHLEFEKAAGIRDRINHIHKIMQHQNVHFPDQKDRDVIGIYREENRVAVAVLKILGGKLLNREIHEFENVGDQSTAELLSLFVRQYYAGYEDFGGQKRDLPSQIILQEEPEGMDELMEWLHNRVYVPQRGENRKLILMARENAFNQIEEAKLSHLRKTARTVFPVQELKDKLGLAKLPRTMICIDISTIQGTDTVSSLVFFENGKPKKKNYRHFIMETLTGQDDFAAMAETMERYLAKIDQYEKPDLIVIDGGKGQLSSATEILRKHNVEGIEIISLAKRIEEVFLPGISESILLPRNSSALRLLVTLRDEAHRFAVTFHRSRRSKRTLTSELDKIPGIGRDKKFLLLKTFGSVENIRRSSLSDLASVTGIGLKTAQKILSGLDSQDITTPIPESSSFEEQ